MRRTRPGYAPSPTGAPAGTTAAMVHSPFAPAFRPGTRFVQEDRGLVEVDTHVIAELEVPSGRLGAADPFVTSFDEGPAAFARRAPTGAFPVELAVARFAQGDARVACARVRFSSTEAVRWEPATFEGQRPLAGDELPGYGVDAGTGCFFDAEARGDVDEATGARWIAAMQVRGVDTWSWHAADLGGANVVMFSSGWGDGFYTSYWGFDADGRVTELVTDFEVLVEAVSERVELPLPLPRGKVEHPLLAKAGVTLRAPFWSRTAAIVGGAGGARVELTGGEPVTMTHEGTERRYTWKQAAPGSRLVVSVMVGARALPTAPGEG